MKTLVSSLFFTLILSTTVNAQFLCPIKKHCSSIESVKLSSSRWNYYSCTDKNGKSFDCTNLVNEFGENIEGEKVLVTIPYVDSCHVPGRCGPRACRPGWGSASINSQCK